MLSLKLKEQAIKLIGPDIHEKLIKGYTETMGRSATDLPIIYHQTSSGSSDFW